MKQFGFLFIKYLKMIRGSKAGNFWTIVFPLILTLLFYLSLSNLRVPQNEPIRIGVETGSPYQQILNQIEIVEATAGSQDTQLQALKDKKIDAFFDQDGTLHVTDSGMRQTIAKEITDQIVQARELGQSARFLQFKSEWISTDQQKTDPIAISFYSLLVMVSIYTAFQGITISLLLQANLSTVALRNNLVPTPKSVLIGAFALGGILFNLLANLLMLFVTEVVLKLNLIDNWPESIALILLGNLFGLSLGLLIGTANRRPEYVKTIAVVAIVMSMSFFSGMMGVDVKNMLTARMPWINRLNPIALLSERLVQSNVLGQSESILPMLTFILGLCAVNFAIATFFLKKRQYQSV